MKQYLAFVFTTVQCSPKVHTVAIWSALNSSCGLQNIIRQWTVWPRKHLPFRQNTDILMSISLIFRPLWKSRHPLANGYPLTKAYGRFGSIAPSPLCGNLSYTDDKLWWQIGLDCEGIMGDRLRSFEINVSQESFLAFFFPFSPTCKLIVYLIKRSLCSKRFRSDLCGFSLSDRADVGMTVRSNSAGKTRKRLLHRLHEALQTLCHVHELAIKYLICLRSKLKFQEPLFSFIVALALKKTSGTCWNIGPKIKLPFAEVPAPQSV